jgi:hypothetical protein
VAIRLDPQDNSRADPPWASRSLTAFLSNETKVSAPSCFALFDVIAGNGPNQYVGIGRDLHRLPA